MADDRFTNETNASLKIALVNEIITGPPADFMLGKSGIYDDQRRIKMLDNATGVGNLLMRFLEQMRKRHRHLDADQVIGADTDARYVEWLDARAKQQGYRVQSLQLDQQDTGLEPDAFTHVFNNFGVFFAPKESAALRDTLRLLQDGGLAFFSSWQKISWWYEVVISAMERYLPDAPALPDPLDLFRKLGWTEGQSTEQKLRNAGFTAVGSEVYSSTPQIDAQSFAAAAAVLFKAVTGKTWDAESREKYESLIEAALYKHLISTWNDGRWTGEVSALVTWGRKS
ncbi:hypothetical protein KC331_g7270 [Hortaea werneckii]|nr:hypothetical protein KC331_g7270 [Hortaea werneckii]KAI7714167.1 hypothetical protein KC353_g7005 [Hortaea werneckii]